MTLPALGSINIGQVAAELGIGLPLSLGDSRVRALAGVASGPISLSDLYGKSAGGTLSAIGNSDTSSMAGNATGITYPGHAFPSVSAGGGTAPYTYLWSITGGTGFTLTNATSATCDVAHSIGPAGFNGTCTLQCIVNDSASHTTNVTGVTAVYTP